MEDIQPDKENNKDLLTQTKKLSDGSFGKIFSQSTVENSYNCHLCKIADLKLESLQAHTSGRKHKQKMGEEYVPDAVAFRAHVKKPKASSLSSNESNVTKSELSFKSLLDGNKKPLIGTDCVKELKSDLYHCNLCNKNCNPSNLLQHLTCQNHRINFLEKFHPDRMTRLSNNQKFNDPIWREEMLTTIAQQVEKKQNPDEIIARMKRDEIISEYKDDEKSLACIALRKSMSDPQTSKFMLPIVTSKKCPSFSIDNSSFKQKKALDAENSLNELCRSKEPEVPQKDEANLVRVCSLLSALDQETGSYAEEVIELLSKALRSERQERNSCNKLLFEEEHMSFLKKVKDELQSKMSSNEVDLKRMKIVEKVIRYIIELIENVNEIVAEEQRKREELETMSDDDLKEILRYFTDLDEKEQENCEKFLQKLKVEDPKRYEMLEQFRNLGDD